MTLLYDELGVVLYTLCCRRVEGYCIDTNENGTTFYFLLALDCPCPTLPLLIKKCNGSASIYKLLLIRCVTFNDLLHLFSLESQVHRTQKHGYVSAPRMSYSWKSILHESGAQP